MSYTSDRDLKTTSTLAEMRAKVAKAKQAVAFDAALGAIASVRASHRFEVRNLAEREAAKVRAGLPARGE